MTDTFQLEQQAWMQVPETLRVMQALGAAGQDVRFVGGCVRDALAGREIKDIDIATPDLPEVVIELLTSAGIKAIPTGIEHGTITAVCNHKTYEITTLRLDLETDGRHAKVAYTDNWVEDAARRDLTINALSCSPTGQVFDPFGGIEDLRQRHVRFVGDAATRIEEDALRLLRFFRFQAWYGGENIDPAGLAATREKAHLLKGLSAERIRSELLRLLAAPDPVHVVRSMLENGIFHNFLSEVKDTEVFERFILLEGRRDPLVRLVALTAGAAMEKLKVLPERLRFSGAEQQHFLSLALPEQRVNLMLERQEMRRVLYRLGAGLVSDLLRLNMAVNSQTFDSDAARKIKEQIANWRPVFFPLQGRDLLAAGMKPGPRVGRVMKATEEWWIEQDFKPVASECVAFALSKERL
ncbi:CCA tRNA nucleotidyltransferase [Kiloniella laminariae]|uniref:CCA tRNA nucleotidyltransferase n=1 Tax=Kiloniella laminariae TaxID=454162 RepID=A0ABT4LPH0_9PROT|nr:CCA tRNA nucleotidyltransferase [Kiloniella laminariae]MCZ4281847.1 CCA tRNA nucleotidyltransferase [Kiloniella laminariae]